MPITKTMPIEGPAYDKSKPETRVPWMQFRQRGLTATQIRDWGSGAKRREIIDEKCGLIEWEDLNHVPAIRHGNLREPQIAAWIQQRFGIAPCDAVFESADYARHLASPDGVLIDPFGYQPGTDDAVLAEIKTSKYDLHPGKIDDARVLITVEPGSKFDRSGYYTQMQWQMHVMNAMLTLFVWEQHDGVIDSETGTFTPIGVPEFVWVKRDEALISQLIKQATSALAEIDAALAQRPQTGDFDVETAALVRDLLTAREDEKIAKQRKDAAWAALKAAHFVDGGDVLLDGGFAKITVSTSTKMVRKTDIDAARAKAPALVARYDALVERFTSESPETTTSFTITPNKEISHS